MQAIDKMRVLSSFFLVLILVSCGPKTIQQFDLLITNVHIVNVETGELIRDQQIGIRGDTIQWIQSMRSHEKFQATKTMDGSGSYTIPGLWDMHVHFRGGTALIGENKNLLPLYTAYGISGVRDAGGDLTPAVMEWRKQIRAGELVGPDIFTSGPKLDGPRATWAGSIPVVTNEDIMVAIDSIESIGADYIKIYDSRISKEAYLGIIAEAAKRGITTSGHMPFTVMLQGSG